MEDVKAGEKRRPLFFRWIQLAGFRAFFSAADHPLRCALRFVPDLFGAVCSCVRCFFRVGCSCICDFLVSRSVAFAAFFVPFSVA